MKASPWLWLLPLGFSLVVGLGPVRAQPGGADDILDRLQRSHVLIPSSSEGNRSVEEALSAKLDKLKALRYARTLVADMRANPAKYKDLPALDQLKDKVLNGGAPQLTNPEMQALLRDLQERHKQSTGGEDPTLPLKPDQLKHLQDSLKPPAAPSSPGAIVPAPGSGPVIATAPPTGTEPDKQAPDGSNSGGAGAGPTAVTPPGEEAAAAPPPPPETPRSSLAEPFAKLANRLKALDTLRDSPAFQRALRDLRNFRSEDNDRWTEWVERMRTWTSRVPGAENANADAVGALAERLATSLPPFDWGLKANPLERLSGPTMPNLSKPDLPSTEGRIGFFVMLGLLALGVGVWLALRRAGILTGGGTPADWKLGPWPVNPATVRSREELIQAFEYLSLLRLGPRARHWNHRAIAERLATGPVGPNAEERRQAVAHLASLYEQARYAPPVDPWPDGDLTDARRELCSLAGVAAA
jgi:hypothetical protein